MPPRRASRPAPPCAPRRRWGTRTPRSPFLARSRAPAGSTGSRCQVAPPRQVCRPAPPRAPRRRRGTMTPHSPFRLGRSRAPPARPRRRGGRRGRLHSSAPRRRRAADCRFSRSTLSGPAATPKLRRSPPTLQQPLPCRATEEESLTVNYEVRGKAARAVRSIRVAVAGPLVLWEAARQTGGRRGRRSRPLRQLQAG